MRTPLSRRLVYPRNRPLRRTRVSRGADPEFDARAQVEALETTMRAFMEAQSAQTAHIREALDRLDKQLARTGREQFKANTLNEAQQKSVETTLEQLRDAANYREREIAQLRESLAASSDAGRMEIIRRLLPVLDGLEEALASGRRMQSATVAPPAPQPVSFWQRLMGKSSVPVREETSSVQGISAWLEGLTFIRDRFLETLAAVNVKPILAEGSDFDPHQHVVVETAPATEAIRPGRIVREHRRGFVHGDTVLRYAEVVVANTPTERSL